MPNRSRNGDVEQTRAGRGAHQGERRQIELDRARARALADHQIELRVFHGRIQHFLDHGTQAVNLIDEQHVPRFEIGQQRCQITGPFEHRTGGLAQIHTQFVGNDVRQRGLAEAGRPKYQYMIQGLAPLARGLYENIHLRLDVRLPDVVGQRLRAHRRSATSSSRPLPPAMMRSCSIPMRDLRLSPLI